MLKQAFLLLWEDCCSYCYKIFIIFLLTRGKLYQAFLYVANLLIESFKFILFSLKKRTLGLGWLKKHDLYLALIIYP